MNTCRKCPNPLPPKVPGVGGQPRQVCDACLKADSARRRDKARANARARGFHLPRSRRKEDVGPPWPLLLPPEAEAREKARLQARIREAYADGLSQEAMLERFGHEALYLARLEGITRTGVKRMAFGSPAP